MCDAHVCSTLGGAKQVSVRLLLACPDPHIAAQLADQRPVAAHCLWEEHDCIIVHGRSIQMKKLCELHAAVRPVAGCMLDEITTAEPNN